jgi:four helix bundle protein
MSQDANRKLEERTEVFGENIIDICKAIKPNLINTPLINQIVRSSTSIGANYMEANNASSKKDFVNKIFIAKKEAQETKHWLRMLAKSENDEAVRSKLRILWQECQELTMIFQSITNKLRVKKSD